MTESLCGAIALPDGTFVRGRGRREPLPAGPRPDFGLYLGTAPDQGQILHKILHRIQHKILHLILRRPDCRPVWRPDWPAEWIDWPDFGTPRDPPRAAAAIERAFALARAGQRVEVACGAGTGRTGTVLACMAILAGHPGEDAVTWVRRNYRPGAVETPGQRRWIRWFAGRARAAEHDNQDADRTDGN